MVLINKVLVNNYFIDKTLSKEDLSFIKKGVDFTGLKVTEHDKIDEERYGNMVLAYLFTFLLYLSLLMHGQMAMQSVQEEKASKISEILLSSVSSTELLAGKMLATSITGIAQMAVWLVPVGIISFTPWGVLPEGMTIDVNVGHLIYYLFNFFLGIFTFITLFVALGSIFENAQESQSGMWPIMILVMIPFFIAMSMGKNPENQIATIASMFPFASIIVMPARMTLVDVPMWQLAFSLAESIVIVFFTLSLAGRIFRVGILHTGKKPTWREVVKWLRYQY